MNRRAQPFVASIFRDCPSQGPYLGRPLRTLTITRSGYEDFDRRYHLCNSEFPRLGCHLSGGRYTKFGVYIDANEEHKWGRVCSRAQKRTQWRMLHASNSGPGTYPMYLMEQKLPTRLVSKHCTAKAVHFSQPQTSSCTFPTKAAQDLHKSVTEPSSPHKPPPPRALATRQERNYSSASGLAEPTKSLKCVYGKCITIGAAFNVPGRMEGSRCRAAAW